MERSHKLESQSQGSKGCLWVEATQENCFRKFAKRRMQLFRAAREISLCGHTVVLSVHRAWPQDAAVPSCVCVDAQVSYGMGQCVCFTYIEPPVSL